MLGEALLVNIASNIIWSVSRKIYLIIAGEEKQIEASIEKYLKEKTDKEFDLPFATNKLEEYLKLPQVADLFNSYTIYVINGDLTQILIEINQQKSPSQIFISDDNVSNYLTNGFLKYLATDARIDQQKIKIFFKHIITLTSGFFIKELNAVQKSLAYSINHRLNYGFNLLAEKLDRCSSIIASSLNFPLLAKNSEFDKLRLKYMEALKARYNKVSIYLLDDFDLDKFYIPPSLSINWQDAFIGRDLPDGNKNRIWSLPFCSWENIFTSNNIVYVTGGAGYGKSLLMKNIIVNQGMLNITDSNEHIIIYGEIKWFIKPDGSFKSMIEFLIECVTFSTLKGEIHDFINYYVDMGRCILLLDALDEVPMDKRKDLYQAIIANLKIINPNNKVCITSRDRGFIPVNSDINYFSIERLDARQIEQYVNKIIHLNKFNQDDKMPFMDQAKGLLDKQFLSSFLILSLLINIYKGERELPETKLELYQKCLDYIAHKTEKPKTGNNFDWKLIARLMKDNTFIELSLLCFPNNREANKDEIVKKLTQIYTEIFIDIATLENAIDEFLRFCSERTELFVQANIESSFKFFHRSFFEYFYSKFIFTRCKDDSEIFNLLVQFDIDSEIFELVLARLKQETQDKYISLIKFVFYKCQTELQLKQVNFTVLNILVLFFQVVNEETFQNKFINLIIENHKIVLKNINSIYNQEIIQNLIIKTNLQNEILSKFENAAYLEMKRFLSKLELRELKFLIEDIYEEGLDKYDSPYNYITMILFAHFRSRSRVLYFYVSTLLSQYKFIDILESLQKGKIECSKRVLQKIDKVITYYHSLSEDKKNIFNNLFSKISS